MFWYEDFWIITLIILPFVYILGKSKHRIGIREVVCIWVGKLDGLRLVDARICNLINLSHY